MARKRKNRFTSRDVVRALADLSAAEPHGRDLGDGTGRTAYVYADGTHCVVGHIAKALALPLPPFKHRLNYRKVATVATEMNWFVDMSFIKLCQALQKMNDGAVGRKRPLTWTEMFDRLEDAIVELVDA